jgi:hypothetical protein
MKNLLAFLAAVCLTFAATGWYLGWFKVKALPAASGHRSVNVDVDTVKMHDDLRSGSEHFRDWIEKHHSTPPAEPIEYGAGETQEKK